MRIKCITTFIDGSRRFEKDDSVTVDDADGARFCGHGWAVADGEQAVVSNASAETTLAVQSSTIGQSASNPGA